MPGENENLYKLKSEILKALAQPTRLKIVDFLSLRGESCVCEIVKLAGAERTGVSKHLSILTRSGILSSRKKGQWVFYKLEMPCAVKFLSCAEEIMRDNCQAKAGVAGRGR
jgi:ArsR family transcriptional regulator